MDIEHSPPTLSVLSTVVMEVEKVAVEKEAEEKVEVMEAVEAVD